MSLRIKKKPQYPRRLWALAGFPDDGKSTFAARMGAPILAIDADHRFDQVMHLVAGDVYEFSDPADNVLVARITAALEDVPYQGVATIVVDSLTQIMAPLVMRAVVDNAAGRNKNKAAAFIDKAVSLRWLQSAVSQWGTDVLWVYHLQDGRDNNGKPVVTTTIPKLELARLTRSLNARLRIVREGAKRGIYVEWARGGNAGMTLWDDTSSWELMPEKLEQAMYDGVQATDSLPSRFTGPDDAIAWAVRYGAYPDTAVAQAAYNAVKAEGQPAGAQEMWDLWIGTVVANDTAVEEDQY
jgi:hypothetical protein